jgi:hypothetical protein
LTLSLKISKQLAWSFRLNFIHSLFIIALFNGPDKADSELARLLLKRTMSMKTNYTTLSENRLKETASTRTDLAGTAVAQISGALRPLLADVFALYLKTKNFHWHMSGSHFRDYHLLLDEHAD